MRIKVVGLQPGSEYAIQVRSKVDELFSEWSPIFEFTTVSTTSPPKVPTGVSWEVVGDSFHGEWDTVTENIDDQPARITRYEIELIGGGITKYQSVTPLVESGQKPKFDLPFETNRALFGTPQPTVTFRVRAVDNKEQKSDWTTVISRTNPIPNPPTSLVATAGINTINLVWTASTSDDVIGYNIYQSTGGAFLGFAAGTSYTHHTATYTAQTLAVTAVDKFGQESDPRTAANTVTPINPFLIDTTAPPLPAFTTASCEITVNPDGVGAKADLVWDFVLPDTAPTDLAGFYIRYRRVGDVVWQVATFQKDDRAGQIELQLAYQSYEFQIKSFDWSANESAWSATMTLDSPDSVPPIGITGVVSTPAPGGMRYVWNAAPEEDVNNYEAQVANDSGFTTGLLNFDTGTTAALVVNGLAPSTIYYMRVRAINTSGDEGAWSTTDSDTTLSYNGTITSITADIIQPSTLGNPITLGAGSALILTAGNIRSNTYNGAGNVYDAAATAGFYLGNDGLKIAQGDVSANAITTGTINTATITLAGTGKIETSGYSGVSGFRLSATGLDIPDGSLSALKVAVGSQLNLLKPGYADFEYYPEWFKTSAGADNNMSKNASATFDAMNDGTAHNNLQYIRHTRSGSTTNSEVYLAPTSTSYIHPCSENTSYTYSVYMRGHPTAAQTVTIGFRWSTGVTAGSALTVPAGSGWTRYSIVRTSPAGATGYVPLQRQTLPNTIGTYYDFDSVQVEETDAKSPRSWRPPGMTTLDGYGIRTGAIRSSNTLTINGVVLPYWSIDTQGAAQFGNLLVRGASVVGSADAEASGSFIQSYNYVAGSQGWIIRSDGMAEFRQVEADSLNGDSIQAGTLSVNTLKSGVLGGDISLVDTGIYAHGPVGEQVGFNGEGFTVTGAPQISITSYSITTDVATVTTAGVHDMSVGNSVRFTDLVGTTTILEADVYTVTAIPTSTTFSFALTAADIGATSISGIVHGGGSGGAKSVPTLINFPSDGTSPNILSSTIETKSLVATDAVIQSDLHLQFGSTLRIASGVDNPTIAPTVSATLKMNAFSLPTGRFGVGRPRGTVGHDGNFYLASTSFSANQFQYEIRRMNRGVDNAGTVVASGTLATGLQAATIGMAYVEGSYWMFYEEFSANYATTNYKVKKFDTAFGTPTTYTLASIATNNSRSAVGGMDHTGADDLLLLYATNAGSNNATLKHFDITGGAPVAGTADLVFTHSGSHDSGLSGVMKGTFDFGGTRIVVNSADDKWYYVYNTSGVNQPNDQWQTYASFIDTSFYDTTAGLFAEINSENGVTWFNTGESFWSGAANIKKKWWVGYTWYDSVGTTHETAMSPFASVEIWKRRWINVNIPDIPSGGTDTPDQARTWSIQQTGTPANNAANLKVRATIGYPNKSTYLDFIATPTVSGGSATNTFAGVATPAKIVSTSGNSFWKGDDTAAFYKLVLTSDQEATTSSGNRPALRVGNIDLATGAATGAHLRIDSDEIGAMATESTVGTLYLNPAGLVQIANGAGTLKVGSAGREMKIIGAGGGSLTTDGSGLDTFTHNLGTTNYAFLITSRDNANVKTFTVTTKNTNTVVIRVNNADGSVVASASGQTFDWIAIGW